MKTYVLILCNFLIFLTLISCDNDDVIYTPNIEQKVIISSTLYGSAPISPLTINSTELIDNYLKISFSASGCSGDSWVVKLIDADIILESYPPQRMLRLSLKNEELCEAYITKEILFDISELQVNGNQVLLNITNNDSQILYEY